MKTLKSSLILTGIFILICGIIYPLVMTGIGQIFFNNKANGSIVKVNGKEVGSKLLGQKFEDEKFFYGRLSSVDYNVTKDKVDILKAVSGSNNLDCYGDRLEGRVKEDVENFIKENKNIKKEDLAQDLFTESASGLDPNITVKAAKIQMDRVSRASGIQKTDLEEMIKNSIDSKNKDDEDLSLINVLDLNIKISDKLGLN